MEGKVDLHIHTYYSDGCISPAEVVRQAKELHYDTIAITDHDGVGGVKEAQAAGDALGVQVISGVEIATEAEDGTSLHILGYYIDVEHDRLTETLSKLMEKRGKRNEKLLKVLAEMGYPVNVSGRFIGKPTIARAMAAAGYIREPKDAFQRGKFLTSPEILAIKKEKLKTAEAIDLIRDAGGIAVLAHPIQIRGYGIPGSAEFYTGLRALIKTLKKQGLKGLECYHPDQTEEQSLQFVNIAEACHLHVTRGSDFHGEVLE